MADREYKVVYKSRIHDHDPYEAEYDNRPYRRDDRYDHDYDDRYGPPPRRSGDVLERASTRSDYGSVRQQPQQMALAPRPRHNTRTEYDFVQDRDDLYPRRSNVVVLDSRDRDLSEWEIIRPERTESGAIIIDTGVPFRSQGYDDRRPRELEVSRGGRDRSVGRSRSIVEAMREVRVTEDESDRRSMYSRGRRAAEEDLVDAPMAARRMPTAVRHDHSPESDVRRRSRSIGFHKSQLRHHDVTESRHERPGAEAVNAGQYLIGHRGERLDEDYDGHASQVGSARPRDRSRRRRSRYHEDDVEYEYERRDRYYEEGINRDFDQRSRRYSPQRAPSPDPEREPEAEPERERRHRRHRRRHRRRDEEEEGSYVSEHYSRREKKYRD
jgi:hypothetical protein